MAHDNEMARSRIVGSARSRGPGTGGSTRNIGPGIDPEATHKDGVAASARGGHVRVVSRSVGPTSIKGGPTQIGRFTVLSLLGQGGMGHVYACYDQQLDRKVAVKVLRPELLRDQKTAATRLMREAQAMARLSHPNIVTVHEAGEVGGMVYVAMEFVPGTSLDVWAGAPHPWQEVLSVFIQAGRGLAAAHRSGIIHRDFKPQNVMLNEEGLVKVLDFGLARVADGNLREEGLTTGADGPEEPGSPLLLTLTRTGTILGTPAYMSPEQHMGEVASAPSDQFSFCVSLYQGLYGALPFCTESLEVLRRDVMRGTHGPPPLRSPVPARIYSALRRGMMPEPGHRFGSMAELLAALERDPMRRFWQGAALVGMVAVTAGVSVAAMGASEVELCPDARSELAGIWDSQQKAAVEASIQAKAPTLAGEVMALVGPRLDAYATEWKDMRNDACLAHAEGRQSAQLFDLRTSCLEQRRASLSTTVQELTSAEGAEIFDVLKAVRALPPLDTCADVEALTAAIPPPTDPALRVRVQRHRETLARAEVLEVTGKAGQGLPMVDGVLADAEARTYEPLLAEAYLRKGSLQMQESAPAAALKSLDEALSVALQIGHSRVAALASSRRGYLLAEGLQRPKEAQEDLLWIKALNRRVQGDIELYKEYLTCAGSIQFNASEFGAAEKLWREAMALAETHGREETLQDIRVQYNLGLLLQVDDRVEEALTVQDRLIALSQRLFGVHYAERPMYEGRRADLLESLGRPRGALRRLQELEGSFGALTAEGRVLLSSEIAEAQSRIEEFASARQRMVELQREVPERFTVHEWAPLMRYAAKSGDVAAVERADAELTTFLAEKDRPMVRYWVLFERGTALAALGRHREAVESLEQSRTALVAGSTGPQDRFRFPELSLELGKSRAKLGDYDGAERELMGALAAYQELVRPGSLLRADAMLALGELALERRRFDEAALWLEKAESVYSPTAEFDYPPLSRTRAALARARAGAANLPG